MFCTACGTRNAAESKFCKQCGHEIDKITHGRVREEDFDRALPEAEQINALLERAYRARKAGDNAQAIALCQEALQLRPDSTTPHSVLGQIYESMGERDLAIHEYERVLQLNPGSIADRVKLDELRNGDLPALPRAAPPHIVFTQPSGAQGGNRWPVGVALAVLLMVVGAGLALTWRGRSTAPPGINTNGATQGDAYTPATANVNPQNVANPSGVGNGAASGTQMAANEKQTPPAQGAAPAYNPYPWTLPPTIIYTVPERTRQVQPPAAVNADPATSVATVRAPGAKAGASGSHIMLPSDDQGDEKGATVIQVTPRDTQKDGQKAQATEPVNPGKIVVTAGPKGVTADNSQPASFDSRSYIAAGNDHEVSGDYDKAIAAYSHALATAGDERGSVYQHIAHSYQLKGDKTSAVSNYRNAISEYRKLLEAGKQVEPAQEGINTCEKAIKACNY